MHMQISSKSAVQVCDYFEILMHASKRQQIIFKFPFIRLHVGSWGKI